MIVLKGSHCLSLKMLIQISSLLHPRSRLKLHFVLSYHLGLVLNELQTVCSSALSATFIIQDGVSYL